MNCNGSKLGKLKNIIFSGLSYIVFGNFLSKFVALLSSILIARLVDKDEYAWLSYADNLYSYIALFSGLGLASALLVVCTNDVTIAKQKGYLNKALVWGGVFELLMSVLLCVLIQIIPIPFPDARRYAWMLLLYPVITFGFNACQAFIRVKRNNKLYAILGAIQTILVCVFSILLVLASGTDGVVLARYIAVGAVVCVAFLYLHKGDRRIKAESPTRDEQKKFISVALALMFANLFSGMMPINETFIVNNLIQDEVITANFKVAGILPSMLPIITSSVMVYYFPIIANLRDGKEIRKKVHQIAAVNAGVVIVVAIIGMIFSPLIIRIFYGEKYVDATALSYQLWVMRAVNATFRMVPLNIMAAIGHSKFNAYVSVFTCIIHAILDYLFISLWNVNGIAYATIIVYIISAIIMWIKFEKSCSNYTK